MELTNRPTVSPVDPHSSDRTTSEASSAAVTADPSLLSVPIPQERRSLHYRVAEALRQAIIKGELAPGDRVLEEDVSRRLAISRGPVREALRQLEQEGFVTSFPNRGTVVLPLTESEIREVLIPLRVLLERFAFNILCDNPSERAFDVLEHELVKMREAAARGDAWAIADADISFHRAVLHLAGHHHSKIIWQSISERTKAYFIRYPGTSNFDETVQKHELLLATLRSLDRNALDALVVSHINDTGLDNATHGATS